MKNLLVIILFLFFCSCKSDNKEPNGFEVIYTTDSHNPVKDTDYSKLDYVFEFTGKSIYKTVSSENQIDWNKLFGIKYLGDDYSIRWGDSYDLQTGKFNIGWYVHDGTALPKYEKVLELNVGQRVRLKIDDSGYSNYYMYYQIEGQPMYLVQPPKNHNKIRLLIHNGYSGGDETLNRSYRVYNKFP